MTLPGESGTSLFLVTAPFRLMLGIIMLSVAFRLLEFPLRTFVVLPLLDCIPLVGLVHRYLLVTGGVASFFL